MKNFAGLVFVALFALDAQAQLKKTYQRVKQAVTGSAKLAHLHYFPGQWETGLSLGYRYSVINVKGNFTGSTVVEAEQKVSTVNSQLSLGVLDNVRLQLSWDYLAAMQVDYTKPANQASTKSKGLKDPLFAAIVRVADAESVKFDLKAGFQPETGDHEQADAANDGNAKLGGHTVVAGAKVIAIVTSNSQISAGLTYSMHSLQNSVDQTTSEIEESEKHNETLIELATLTELTPELFFGLTLEIANVEGYKSMNLTTRDTDDVGSISGKTLNLIGKYEITPDSLIEAQIGYLLDYSTETSNIDVSADGYSLSAGYTVRF